MNYTIFIGNDIDKLSDFIELYIFNKTEHINLFRTLKELKLLFPIIRELEDYSEDVNLYKKEIEQLIEEIEKIQKNDCLKNNYFLTSLYISAKKALDKDLQLICIGGEDQVMWGNVSDVLLCDCCRLVLEYYGITDKNKGCGNR